MPNHVVELRAIQLALQHWIPSPPLLILSVKVHSNNTTLIAYINHWGCTRSQTAKGCRVHSEFGKVSCSVPVLGAYCRCWKLKRGLPKSARRFVLCASVLSLLPIPRGINFGCPSGLKIACPMMQKKTVFTSKIAFLKYDTDSWDHAGSGWDYAGLNQI